MGERELRAEKARILLDDPVLKQAIAGVEASAFEALLTAPDDQARRELIDRIKAVRDVSSQLSAWIVDGKQAAKVVRIA